MTRQAETIADLRLIQNVQERLTAVVVQGRKPTLPEEARSDELLVRACASRVWVEVKVEAGTVHIRSAADSPMVAGLVHLLCSIYDGCEATAVAADEPVLWRELRFDTQLSPTRLNGLAAVWAKIRQVAEAG
jgi:cysteine desulfuration protein SufE